MDNPLALFSKKPCQGQTACERELERLHADLDAEKNQTQEAFAHLSVELRWLREKAEYDHQRAVKELSARRKCQTVRDFQRCLYNPAADSVGYWLQSTENESLHLCGRETYAKLEQLLETLNKIAREQPLYKLHKWQGFELEKAIFLYRLLKAYRILLQKKQRTGCSRHSVKHFSRKLPQKDRISSCLTGLLQPCSRFNLQRFHSGSHLLNKQSKHNQQERPVGKDPCLPATALDTCWSCTLKVCHPLNIPHAGSTTPSPHCIKLCRSEESPPPRCMDRNMEVGYFIFPNSTHDLKTNVSKKNFKCIFRVP